MSPQSPLNEEQARAVACRDPRILCLSGPGSGKTRTLVARIESLITESSFSPSEVLALTFTRKAAREMRSRLVDRIGVGRANRVELSTFHSWQCGILRRYADRLGMRNDFTVRDDADRNALILYVGMKELGLKWRSSRRLWKEQDVRDRYYSILSETNSLDFDGIESCFLLLLEKENVSRQLRERFRHVLIDEGQDMSKAQQLSIEAFGPDALFVVGDPAQSLYGFRGAHPEGLHAMVERGWTVFELRTNYRSLPAIVEAASRVALAMEDPGLEQWSGRFEEEPASGWSGFGEIETALRDSDRIAEDLEALDVIRAPFVSEFGHYDVEALERSIVEDLGHVWRNTESEWYECAILAPTWFPLKQLAEKLEHAGIPYEIAKGGARAFDTDEGRAVVAALRATANDRDHLSLREALSAFDTELDAGIWAQHRARSLRTGTPLVELFVEWSLVGHAIHDAREALRSPYPIDRKELPWFTICAAYRATLIGLGMNARAEKVEDVLKALDEWGHSEIDGFEIHRFLDWVSRSGLDDLDELDAEKPDRLTLSSIHGAKGLEWRNVWILRCDEGSLPRGDRTSEDGRRLFYVALTRGRDRVRLCVCGEPSRFVAEALPLLPPFSLESGSSPEASP